MFKEIVVGVDEQMGTRDAIALATNLLARGGEITLAHVYADESNVQRSVRAPDKAQGRMDALELLETTREEAGVQAHLRLRGSSSVGRGLHELCEGMDADLLVVGSSRRGLLGRVRVGDATRAVLNGAPCAIAIAPAAASFAARTPASAAKPACRAFASVPKARCTPPAAGTASAIAVAN